MKVMVNIEVDVPEQFMKNGEPDISVDVFGFDQSDGKATALYPESVYIFKESEVKTF